MMRAFAALLPAVSALLLFAGSAQAGPSCGGGQHLIDETLAFAEERQIAPERFEFQMLYGVRRDYQREIAAAGYNVKIYVPFGAEWCPYFMRRIAERPANALFVMRALLRG